MSTLPGRDHVDCRSLPNMAEAEPLDVGRWRDTRREKLSSLCPGSRVVVGTLSYRRGGLPRGGVTKKVTAYRMEGPAGGKVPRTMAPNGYTAGVSLGFLDLPGGGWWFPMAGGRDRYPG